MTINKYRILNMASWLSLLSAFFLIAIVTYWSVYPYKTLVIENQPMEVLTPTVGRGVPLVYKVKYCKYTKLNAVVYRSFENDIVFPSTSSTGVKATGCGESTVTLVIPYELPSGTYRLKNIYTYKVNPIRELSVVAVTEYFNVVERD